MSTDHNVRECFPVEELIRIGIRSCVSFGFVRDLHYRGHHPATAIDIVEGSASEQIARITDRHLDIAFVILLVAIGAVLIADCKAAFRYVDTSRLN